MNFKKVLCNGCFCLNLVSNTKRGIIEEMVDMLFKAGKLPDREAALHGVLERERKMSTGMQYGVAIPHGKTNTVDGLVTAFALKKEGINFDALDGQPSRIFIMTISSANRTGPHMQYLTEISKVLNTPAIRERLMNVQSVDEVIALLTDDEDDKAGEESDTGKG
ncbi:MAG: PTS sucrose transporter subunit IIABC [Verrucomicrobia bacterium]|nr:PTS sucrose transporter subunit IIABC [Verrucomicrobiota bacterium]